jgi:hypothetical protein
MPPTAECHQPLSPGNVHYYQGLHDVASVLLLVAGEPCAFDMLCRLTSGHLRDATRASLDPVIELLHLMGPIVSAADEELGSFLGKQGLPPFYALSWFITWFSHDLADFGEVGLGWAALRCGVVWCVPLWCAFALAGLATRLTCCLFLLLLLLLLLCRWWWSTRCAGCLTCSWPPTR